MRCPTAARGGKGDAYEYCKRCHPGAIAADPDARMGARRDARMASSDTAGRRRRPTGLARTPRRRGGEALKRLGDGDWPPSSTVIDLYGTWAAALADAFPET